MAINKQAIIDAVFQGAGKVAKNPQPPTIWSYNDAVVDDPYDPVAAKKMLEEEGVKGLKAKVWAMPVQRPYMPNARRTAEMIQADFAAVGVTVEIVSYEWAEYLKRSKEKDRDGAVILGWTGDNGDPDNFLAVLLGCDAVGNANRAQWCYKPFDELIQKAKVSVGAGIWIRRISCVPSAQLAAASSISATPVGLPPSLSISFHSSSNTPPAAAATPAQARAGKRSLKKRAPMAAEKIGMV